MAGKKRTPRARNRCAEFADSALTGCARASIEDVLEAHHKPLVKGGRSVACGVALDRCIQPHEPSVLRWDYIFTIDSGAEGARPAIGIEVHPAVANHVAEMIGKMQWARDYLAKECPNVKVRTWIWLAPPESDVMFTPQHPSARALAEAGILFPRKQVTIP